MQKEFLYLIIAILVVICAGLLFYAMNIGKHSNKKQQNKNTMLDAIYKLTPDIVFTMDKEGRFKNCNTSFEKFLNLNESQIVGKKISELMQEPPECFTVQSLALRGEFVCNEEEITYSDGNKRFVETIQIPLRQNRNVLGIIGISRDVTERKSSEEAAKVASKAKSEFLAHMSHEIRTPLNAIIGMANIAKTTIKDRERTEWAITQILTSSHHLLDILNDVLDMAKIESGKLELYYNSFTLKDAIREVIEIINQRCSEKSISFITDIESVGEQTVIGDKLRLNQVLLNLLGNAVKFTANNGEVKLKVELVEDNDTSVRLCFFVFDNGIGMDKEQIEKLFTAFEQTKSSIAVKFGGTGLGLSISQNIINLMGSKIKVESIPNEGSKFFFEIELDKGIANENTQEEIEVLPSLAGKRILVAEDVELNRIILREILSGTQVEIVEAENGQDAVELFSKQQFDLVFMDIQMPIMDGYEATKEIRKLDQTTPIIAMTANAYKEDVERAKENGMNGHIAKPFDMQTLLNIVTAELNK